MRIRPTRFAKIAGAAATALLCALALGSATATAATTHAWAQDGFDAGNTGFNPNETTINRTNIGTTIDWRWSITSPLVEPFFCRAEQPPVVAGGRLFLTDQRGFAAYNAATGAPLWSVRLASPDENGVTALAVSGTTLLVALMHDCQSASSQFGEMAAYSVTDGALLWSQTRDAPISTMVVDNGVVVAMGADATAPLTTAYRVSDGHIVWQLTRSGSDVAASAGGRMLVGTDTGTEAVTIATGAVLWSTPTTWFPQAGTPDGARFVVSTPTGDLAEINASNGAVAWTQPGFGGPVAVDNLQVYAVHNGHLNVFASSNGVFSWSDTFLFAPVGRPIVAGGVVYLVNNGFVTTLNSTTGSDLGFQFGFNQGDIGHVVVENGRLYITTGRVLDTFTP